MDTPNEFVEFYLYRHFLFVARLTRLARQRLHQTDDRVSTRHGDRDFAADGDETHEQQGVSNEIVHVIDYEDDIYELGYR